MRQKTIHYLITFILFVFALILIWPALQNGYPLVYSDSGTYINAGFTKIIPVDRPILYCMFVKYMSLKKSLWFVIIAQAFIVLFVIHMLTRKFTTKNITLLSIIIIVILSFTTGLSNYTSQIMPDIFSAIAIIGFAVILTSDKIGWRETILSLIVVFSAMTNFSNFFVLAGLLIVAIILWLFHFIKPKILLWGTIVTIAPFLLILSINKTYSGKFQISRAGSVFIIARMIETGIVKKYLVQHCENHKYILCDQIDSIPNSSADFLWNDNSPLYDTNCMKKGFDCCWESKNSKFSELINDILTTSDNSLQLSAIYLKDFFRQIVDFKIGVLVPMRDNSPPQNCIDFRFKNEIDSYKNADQYESTQEFKTMSFIQLISVIMSVLFIIAIFIFYRKLKIKTRHSILIIFLILGILGNAMTVTIFSTVLDRYQARVIWIIPFIGLLLLYHYIIENKHNGNS